MSVSRWKSWESSIFQHRMLDLSAAPIWCSGPGRFLQSIWSSVYIGISKAWVLIQVTECLSHRIDELACEHECKHRKGKASFFHVPVRGPTPEGVLQIGSGSSCFRESRKPLTGGPRGLGFSCLQMQSRQQPRLTIIRGIMLQYIWMSISTNIVYVLSSLSFWLLCIFIASFSDK